MQLLECNFYGVFMPQNQYIQSVILKCSLCNISSDITLIFVVYLKCKSSILSVLKFAFFQCDFYGASITCIFYKCLNVEGNNIHATVDIVTITCNGVQWKVAYSRLLQSQTNYSPSTALPLYFKCNYLQCSQRQNIEFTHLESAAEVVDGKKFQILHCLKLWIDKNNRENDNVGWYIIT